MHWWLKLLRVNCGTHYTRAGTKQATVLQHNTQSLLLIPAPQRATKSTSAWVVKSYFTKNTKQLYNSDKPCDNKTSCHRVLVSAILIIKHPQKTVRIIGHFDVTIHVDNRWHRNSTIVYILKIYRARWDLYGSVSIDSKPLECSHLQPPVLIVNCHNHTGINHGNCNVYFILH